MDYREAIEFLEELRNNITIFELSQIEDIGNLCQDILDEADKLI